MIVDTAFPDIDARFEKFHIDNPHVYAHFESFTFRAIRAGRSHYSAECVIQAVRWHLNIVTKTDEGFKVNDHFRKRYGLLFMQTHPEHAGFFETREPGDGPEPGPWGRGAAS